jgi:hypothetical protein
MQAGGVEGNGDGVREFHEAGDLFTLGAGMPEIP